MEIASAVRRLRNLVNDKPYGISKSDVSPATTVVANPTPTLKVAFGSGASVSVSFASAGASTAAIIAGRLQAAIRAAAPSDLNYAFATVTYADGYYIVKSGAFGSDNFTVITAGDANDVSAALKLGQQNGGTEYLSPSPRYTDADLETYINYGIVAWNASVPANKQVSLDTATDEQITPCLYQAWILVLESDAGSAVYSYRQTIGGDTMDMAQVFTNILELLRYLRGQLTTMREDLGVGGIFVSDLTRYDRLSDMRAPVYLPNAMPRPTFLQLRKLSASSVLIEWPVVRAQDFARALVFSSPTGGLVDYSKLNDASAQVQAGAVRQDAISHAQIVNPTTTVLTVINLANVNQFFVIVYQDTRGQYYYSDEMSLDITTSNPVPVREVVNDYPKG